MTNRKLSRVRIAEHQLARAAQLMETERDYLSVITLAGAAEEVFGRILTNAGRPTEMSELIAGLQLLAEQRTGKQPTEKELAMMMNWARNNLKHIGDSEDVEMNWKDEAQVMIDRAFNNFMLYTGRREPKLIEGL